MTTFKQNDRVWHKRNRKWGTVVGSRVFRPLTKSWGYPVKLDSGEQVTWAEKELDEIAGRTSRIIFRGDIVFNTGARRAGVVGRLFEDAAMVIYVGDTFFTRTSLALLAPIHRLFHVGDAVQTESGIVSKVTKIDGPFVWLEDTPRVRFRSTSLELRVRSSVADQFSAVNAEDEVTPIPTPNAFRSVEPWHKAPVAGYMDGGFVPTQEGSAMGKPLHESADVAITYKDVPIPQEIVEHWTSSWGEKWRSGVDAAFDAFPHGSNTPPPPDDPTLGVLYRSKELADEWFVFNLDGRMAYRAATPGARWVRSASSAKYLHNSDTVHPVGVSHLDPSAVQW